MAQDSRPVHSTTTIPDAFLDVRGLSRYLNIKPSTLYAWVAQKRIPALKIHGLVRFRREDIDLWIAGFQKEQATPALASSDQSRPFSPLSIDLSGNLDRMIARAKQQAYNPRHGETRPKPSPNGKEEE
jgi:excisionase family DNA binding protein